MITLTHTRMQVPTDRVRVVGLKHMEVGGGVAWSVTLRDGTSRLGTITNDGNGGVTLFRPVDAAARRTVDGFVAQCRDRDGEPVSEEFVLDQLTDEFEYACHASQADYEGAYLVRYFDRHGIPDLMTFWLTRITPPDYRPALDARTQVGLPEEAVRAELWMGYDRGWVEFYRAVGAAG